MSRARAAAPATSGAALTGSAPTGPATADRTVRAQRIDWRFVLPDAGAGRVVWLGADDDEAAAALREAGWQIDGPAAPNALEADLVVVAAATAADLATGVAMVRPGGVILALTSGPRQRLARDGRRTRALAPGHVAARLRTAGFTSIRTQLHVPSATRRSAIVPIDDPGALRLFLVHHGGVIARRAVTGLAEVARRSGWLARLAPAASVVARRPGAEAAPGSGSVGGDAVSRHLAGIGPAAGASHPAPLLLTPSFRASRHVVALVPSQDGRRPEIVAKIARIADSGRVTDREAAVLRAVAAAPPLVRDSAPRCLAVGRPWGLATLVESGVVGAPLDPAAVRRDPDGAIALVVPWLAALATDRAVARPIAERLDRLVDGPLRAYERAAPPDDAERRRIERTLTLVERLRGSALPVVIEHGDVSHPNLLVGGDGRLLAVDWELGDPDGLPGHDLTGFLGYIAIARAAAGRPADQARTVRALHLGDAPWAEAAARTYAQAVHVAADLLPALTVLSWARRVVGLADRLHDGIPTSIDAGTGAWIRAHRFSAAWAAAIERLDAVRPR